jgi:putative sterol carrier protein
VDTSSGNLVLEVEHIEPVDLTVTIDYPVAKAILVEGDPNAGFQAFMQGKVKVDGDISKLMALQTLTPDPVAAEIGARIQAMTA